MSRAVSLLFVLSIVAFGGRYAGADLQAGLRASGPPAVRVAAASDLKFALDQVIARLGAAADPVRVEAVYGASGNFHAQLRQRAPFDVFLSADIEYPNDLIRRGAGDARDLFTYAHGRLVVWTTKTSTLPIERDGIRAVAAARRIAIANPRHAPYGRAAAAAMRQAGVWDSVSPRLVLAENVAQAAQFVQTGAADVGIIGKALAVAAPMRQAGRSVDVPADAHPAIVQAGLILPWARDRRGAERLRDFLISREGRALLEANGLEPPPLVRLRRR